jgi:hypothetical protein
MKDFREQKIIFFERDFTQFPKKSKGFVPVLIIVDEANAFG